jgi:hypothetical protein
LAAAARRGAATKRGASYLRRVQKRGGGFALAGSGGPNSQSTAWAVQGLIAAGADPGAIRKGGRSPLDYLAARQDRDGHYRYSTTSDQTPVWVTGQALLAVERQALPLPPVGRAKGHGRAPGAGAASERPRGERSGQRGAGPRPAGRRVAGAPGDGSPPGGGQPGSQDAGGAGLRLTGAPAGATTSTPDGSGDRAATTTYVAAGFVLLAAALGGGFLVYRRRLR